MSRHPIQSILLLPLLAGFALLFVIVLVSLQHFQHSHIHEHVAQARYLAVGMLQAEVTGEARLMELQFVRLARRAEVREAVQGRDAVALTRLGQTVFESGGVDAGVSYLGFVTPQGEVLAWLDGVADATGQLHLGSAEGFSYGLSWGAGGELTLWGVWPWQETEGAWLGYLVAGRRVDWMLGHLAEALRLQVYTVPVGAELPAGLPEAFAAVLPSMMSTGQQALSAPVRHAGGEYGLALAPLMVNGQEQGTLVVVIELTHLMGELQRTVWVVGGAAILLGGALMLLFHVLLQRVEARLVQSGQKINSYVMELETANAELGQREKQLASVSESRQRAKMQLQEAYDHMEERVERRTHELTETNRQLQAEIERRLGAMELLRQSERRFGALSAMAPVGIFQTDVEGRLRYANERFFRLCGLPAGEVGEWNWQEVLRPADRVYLHSEWQRACRDDLPFQFEYRFQHSTGETVWALCQTVVERESDGRVVGSIGTLTDITERKQTENERVMLAAAIEQATEVVYITDPQGIIQYVNPAFERVTGYTSAEVIGRPATILRSSQHGPRLFKQMWETLRGGQVWQGRLTNRRRDGGLFETETNISPIQEYGGEITSFVAVARDVTNELMLERQLRQSQKLEAIGTLAGGIAHDFNNLLTPVLGFTELAIEELPTDSQMHKNLTMVFQAGQRAKELVAQILMFNRSTDHSPKPLRLDLVLKEAVRLLRASLPATIKMETYWDPACGAVFADPTQMHQVVMNLCTNAAHAMRERGGTLEVRLEHRLGEPTEVGEGGATGEWVVITVRDTGEGIAPAVLERIFDPFFTTKGAGEGTGLGLSVVHGIVRGCGGRIEVRSTVGEGAEFQVFLPALSTVQEDAVPARMAPVRQQGLVLLVDDEPLVLELGRQMLTRLGFEVVAKSDPREAWAWFEGHAEQVMMVVTDHTMPHLTGVDLADRMLTRRPGLPMVLCTGYTDRLGEEDARAMGFGAYLLKPLSQDGLTGAMRQALGRARP